MSCCFRKSLIAVFISLLVILTGCGGGTTTETINNNLPVAKITDIDVLAPKVIASLNGEDSFDLDSDPLSFDWSITQKPEDSDATIDDNTAKNTFLLPDVLGDYEITLIVNDGKADSEPTKLPIKVRDTLTNVKPIANAGNSLNLEIGEVVNLDGSKSSDSEGASLKYEWSFLSVPTNSQSQIINANAIAASFTTDVAGEYKIALVVNDGVADSTIDVILVTAIDPPVVITEPNDIPIANAGQNQVMKLGYTSYLDGAGSYDPDKDALTFAWTLVSGPTGNNPHISDPTLIRPTIRPDIGGTYTFNLTVNDGTVDSLVDSVTVITTEGRSEVEPNDVPTQAQTMVDIGLNLPIAASINTSTDVDWYHFEVKKDQTYVIELFNVSNAFRDEVGRKCGSSTNGLYVKLLDQDNTAITSRCVPFGSGDVHTFLEFKAAYSGPYQLEVASNSTAIGDYNLRILPGFGSDKAMWDSAMEPNGSGYTAYKLDVGHTHAITAKLEARTEAYTTNRSDVDWYRISANAGETYVVELFDVALGLVQTRGANCNGTNYNGLSLRLFSPDYVELKKQCDPIGAGDVNNTLQFTANIEGDFHLQVASNALAGFDNGTYSIRVLPKHIDPSATWDAVTFEPNNTLVNSYAIKLGYENSRTSTLDTRSETVATNRADVDWYHFTATANQTYIVELFNVAMGLVQTRGANCNGTNYNGLSLRAFDAIALELKTQCEPIGAANVHNSLIFTTPTAGKFYVQIASNARFSTDSGDYSIRVLPKYDDPAATWDEVSFEPNNRASTAHIIELGQANALTSTLAARSETVATNRADVDWYRFSADANQAYIVELFDVALGLVQTRGAGCNGTNYNGLSLRAFDAAYVELKKQCNPIGTGNVHNTLEITTSDAGDYFIHVASNALTSFDNGSYSIRISPK